MYAALHNHIKCPMPYALSCHVESLCKNKRQILDVHHQATSSDRHRMSYCSKCLRVMSAGSPLLYFYGREYWVTNRASSALAGLADKREGKLKREIATLQQSLQTKDQQCTEAVRLLSQVCCAVLYCTVLRCAALRCAVLCCAVLCWRQHEAVRFCLLLTAATLYCFLGTEVRFRMPNAVQILLSV